MRICEYEGMKFVDTVGVNDIHNGGNTWRTLTLDQKIILSDYKFNPDGMFYACHLAETDKCLTQERTLGVKCIDCERYKKREEALKHGKWEECPTSSN